MFAHAGIRDYHASRDSQKLIRPPSAVASSTFSFTSRHLENSSSSAKASLIEGDRTIFSAKRVVKIIPSVWMMNAGSSVSHSDYFRLACARRIHTAIGLRTTAYHHTLGFKQRRARPIIFQIRGPTEGILPIHTWVRRQSGLIPPAISAALRRALGTGVPSRSRLRGTGAECVMTRPVKPSTCTFASSPTQFVPADRTFGLPDLLAPETPQNRRKTEEEEEKKLSAAARRLGAFEV